MLIKINFLVLFSLLFSGTLQAQISYSWDNSPPDSSAALDIKSIEQGILIPRMDSLQRNAIVSPAISLLVFDTDTESFWFNGTNGWEELRTIDTDTDDQTIDVLALNGSNLEISLSDDGEATKTLDLSSLNTSQILIEDTDADTKVQVEASADEDIIRFNLAGTNYLNLEKTGNFARFNFSNNSNNILFGNNISETLTGGNNIVLGYDTAPNLTSAESNIIIGRFSGLGNTTGGYNIFMGQNAGRLNESGNFNVFIGPSAGRNNLTSDHSVIIGYKAGFNSIGGKNIFLGYQAGYDENGSNKLYIENSGSSSPLIYGEFNNDLLRINGTLNINNEFSFPLTDGTAGQVLQTDGNGLVNWQSITNLDNDPANEIQTLSLDGTLLNLSDAAPVDLSVLDTDPVNEIQTLSLDGTVLNLSDAPPVDLSTLDTDPANEIQTLSLDGTVLNLSDAAPVDLSVLQSISTLKDADTDTKIQVEENTDEDIIRFDIRGTESMTLADELITKVPTRITATQRNALTIQTANNAIEAGLAFRNAGSSFSWSMFRQPIPDNVGQAHLVIAGGNSVDNLENLTERFRISNTGNIGIGASNPGAKLHVNGGDVYIEKMNRGIIMTDSAGNCWRVTVATNGSLTTASITCP